MRSCLYPATASLASTAMSLQQFAVSSSCCYFKYLYSASFPFDFADFSLFAGMIIHCEATCPAGRASDTRSKECTVCQPGKYAEKDGSQVCLDCLGNYWSSKESANCTLCVKNYFYHPNPADDKSVDDPNDHCVPCSDKTKCPENGESTLETLTLKSGYWRIAATSTEIYECRKKNACVGGPNFTDGGAGYCEHGYIGPLCDVCDKNFFYDVGSDECLECDESREAFQVLSSAGVIFIACLIFVGLLLFCYQQKYFKGDGALAKLLVINTKSEYNFACCFRRSIDSDKLAGVQSVSEFGFRFRKLYKKVMVRAKAIWSFGQIAVNVGFNCSISFPPIYEVVLTHFRFVNVDIFPVFGLSCIAQYNYSRTMVFATLAPIIVVALLWLQYLYVSCVWGGKSQEAQSKRFASYMYAFLIITYIVLIGSSVKAIHFFKCEAFEVPDEKTEYYLAADLGVECYTPSYNMHFWYAWIMVLIYPIGIPLFYYVMVRKHRDILSDPEASAKEEELGNPTVGHITFLTESYSYKYCKLRSPQTYDLCSFFDSYSVRPVVHIFFVLQIGSKVLSASVDCCLPL